MQTKQIIRTGADNIDGNTLTCVSKCGTSQRASERESEREKSFLFVDCLFFGDIGIGQRRTRTHTVTDTQTEDN